VPKVLDTSTDCLPPLLATVVFSLSKKRNLKEITDGEAIFSARRRVLKGYVLYKSKQCFKFSFILTDKTVRPTSRPIEKYFY